MKLVFAAGGTAGHINPALAVADKIKAILPESEILFIGTPKGLEATLVPKAGYDFKGIEMAGIQRSISLNSIKRNFKALYHYVTAKKRAREILAEFKPDIVMGTGGYVTASVLGAAVKMGIKTVTHESNSFPGVATKMLAAKLDRVFLASDDAKKYLSPKGNYVVTGNPLRTNIKIQPKDEARKALGLPEGITILSFGGSQGASRLNEAVSALIPWERKHGGINHIHGFGIHGRELYGRLSKTLAFDKDERLIVKEYIDNMYTCLCAADLVISRAGAMTLAELELVGRAAILVPYPNAAENHQYYNALTLQNEGAAVVIEDKELSSTRLISEVERLCADKNTLEVMGEKAKKLAITDAADRITGEIIDLVEK